MWISRYIGLFAIYGILGWVYESTFCTIKTKKWENRGFLYGPLCPIYSVGAISISLIVSLCRSNGLELNSWKIFLISFLGSMILEYITSWGLEKLFHAIWWDYSHLPLNLKGRISLFTSIGFGLGGMLIVYVIAPFSENVVDKIPAIWMELIALLFVMIFSIDMTLTITALTSFEDMIINAEKFFDGRMENLVGNAQNRMCYYGKLGKKAIRRVKKFKYIKINSEKINNFLNEVKSTISGDT